MSLEVDEIKAIEETDGVIMVNEWVPDQKRSKNQLESGLSKGIIL